MAFTNLHRLDMVAKRFLKNVVYGRVRGHGRSQSKNRRFRHAGGAPAQAQPSGLSRLSSFFNFDGDGSISDDLPGIASKKFFGA
jgi:hypothetical protein